MKALDRPFTKIINGNAIGRAGVEASETGASAPIVLVERDIELPDLLTDLQDKAQLTRRSLVRILTESERLDDLKRNPHATAKVPRLNVGRRILPRSLLVKIL